MKKRKLEETVVQSEPPSKALAGLFTLADLAFQQPRKKMDMVFGKESLYLEVRSANGTLVERVIAYKDILNLLCLPTPEKTRRHTSLAVQYRSKESNDGQHEFVLCSFPDDKPALQVALLKTLSSTDLEKNSLEAVSTILNELEEESISNTVALKRLFHAILPSQVMIEPSEAVFRSKAPGTLGSSSSTSSRGGQGQKEVQYHVVAYLKAKDGYLYFLKSGVFFGFKKPILFFEKESLHSIQVASRTSRTFDLEVKYRQMLSTDANDSVKSITFGMIDIAEMEGINAYISELRLHQPSASVGILTADVKGKQPVTEETRSPGGGHENIDEDDEEDDSDFVLDDDESSVPEEYDSQYESDGESENEEEEEEETEEEESEEEDVEL